MQWTFQTDHLPVCLELKVKTCTLTVTGSVVVEVDGYWLPDKWVDGEHKAKFEGVPLLGTGFAGHSRRGGHGEWRPWLVAG